MQDIQIHYLNDNLVDHLITIVSTETAVVETALQTEISKMNNRARKASLTEKRVPSLRICAGAFKKFITYSKPRRKSS